MEPMTVMEPTQKSIVQLTKAEVKPPARPPPPSLLSARPPRALTPSSIRMSSPKTVPSAQQIMMHSTSLVPTALTTPHREGREAYRREQGVRIPLLYPPAAGKAYPPAYDYRGRVHYSAQHPYPPGFRLAAQKHSSCTDYTANRPAM